MNHVDVTKLVSKLRFKIKPNHRRFKTPDGPPGRLDRMRRTVTALIKYERIQLYYPRADESRGYAERLISDAIRHGDQHAPTMEMANFWITEKQYIHKLFKVLVPRFQNSPLSYTRMYKAPTIYPNYQLRSSSVLELRGNPFPALRPDLSYNRNFLHNVLLDEAKKVYRRKKYEQLIGENSAEVASQQENNIDKMAEQLEKFEMNDNTGKMASDEKASENGTKKE